jgi:hypothetical protein
MVDLSRPPLNRSRGPNRRTRRPLINAYVPGELSSAEEMSLWLGDPSDGVFPSSEARKQAWFDHREHMLERYGRDAKRPMAWWQYSRPSALPWPGYDHQAKFLFLASALDPQEERKLLAEWRTVWRAAQTLPAVKRRAALAAADIPKCVLEYFAAEAATTPAAAKPS